MSLKSALYGQAGKFETLANTRTNYPISTPTIKHIRESKTLFQDEDGDSYIFPYIYPYRTIPTGFFINSKAFDANNIAYPTNTEELYQAAKSLRLHIPIPIRDFLYCGGNPDCLVPRVWHEPIHLLFQRQGCLCIRPLMPEYGEMLEYLNKLYAEELYDPQFPSMYSQVTTGDRHWLLRKVS